VSAVADCLPGPTYVRVLSALTDAYDTCQRAHGPLCWPCPKLPVGAA
jgi:hypothetical protein